MATLIPIDIQQEINRLYQDHESRIEVRDILSGCYTRSINVGPDQLARSILIIAQNDLERIRAIALDFFGDPRDVIMEAEAHGGFPGHSGSRPFGLPDKKKR